MASCAPGSIGMGERPHGGELAVVTILTVLAVVAGVAWAGGQVAALVFGGHEPLAIGWGDAIAAVPHLVTDPREPAAAWPAPAAAELPGAAAYWVATGAVLAAAAVGMAVIATAAGMLPGHAGLAPRRRMGLDPEGRFARARDLAPMWISTPQPGRMILGHHRTGLARPDWLARHLPRRLLRRFSRALATENPALPLDPSVPRRLRPWARRRRGQRGSVLVLGPSQCGKTSALAVPAILEWAGPVIALSVKTDLMGATIDLRRRAGEVKVFDPAAATGEVGSSWSPLRESTSLTGARRAARSIANATSWTHDAGEMGFWSEAGEDLLATLFWIAATIGAGIDTVVRWVVGMDHDTVRRLLVPLAEHATPDVAAEASHVLEAFDGVWRSDPRQVSSIYLTARTMIRPWQEPTVQAAALPSGAMENDHLSAGIDLDWLLGDVSESGHSGRRPWNTVYLCADLDEAERLAPVLGGLLDDLMKQAYAHAGAANAPLDPPLLVVVDEAGNWPIRSLPSRISTCAGLGIQLLLVFQSKAQIDAAYGRRSDVVISNAVTKVFFAGLSDESTLRYAAQLLGDEHVTARSVSHDASIAATAGGRRNVSEQPTRVELLPPSLLRQVPPGQALLVHNTLRPAHLHGRYWFRDPNLYALATGQQLRRSQPERRSTRHKPPAAARTAP
jgi:type IV secretion system protein VirD4